MWQDGHSGLRGHALMTRELGDTIPAALRQREREGLRLRPRARQAVQPVQQLDLVHHRVGRQDRASASVSSRGSRRSLGTSIWTELAEVAVFGSVPAVERDLYWKPRPSARSGDSRRGWRPSDLSRRTDNERRQPCLTRTERRQPSPETQGGMLPTVPLGTRRTTRPPQSSMKGRPGPTPRLRRTRCVSIKGGRAVNRGAAAVVGPDIETFDDHARRSRL